MWKISLKLVDGFHIEMRDYGRRGKLCTVKTIPTTAPNQAKRAAEASLAVKGSKLFNILPIEIRNITSNKTEVFKNALDHYLGTIPGKPTSQEEGRASETNSRLPQIPMSRQQ